MSSSNKKINLLQAISEENIGKIAELLEDRKTNVNYTDNHNFSALHHAVRKKNADAVKLLLKHRKIDVRIRCYEGYTALHLACRIQDIPLEIVEILLEFDKTLVGILNNENVAPIQNAVSIRRLDVVRTLVKFGADVNHTDLDGDNCLHYASAIAEYDIVEFLLNETNIDPTARNLENLNALCVLIVRSFPIFENRDVIFRCCCILLERSYGKEITIDDTFQPTILCAAYNSFMVEYFIHQFYSKNNSKYRLIEELEKIPTLSEDREFRFYIYAFLHDNISKSHLSKHPRLLEINDTMMGRSLLIFLMKSLFSDAANELVIEVLDHLHAIGFKEPLYMGEIGSDFLVSLSDKLVSLEICKRLFRIFKYLSAKEMDMNRILGAFLEISLIQNEHSFSWKIVYLLLPFMTSFFVDLRFWQQVFSWTSLNSRQFMSNLLQTYGDYHSLPEEIFNNSNDCFHPVVQSLQQLTRNRIRKNLLAHSKGNQEFFDRLDQLAIDLPGHLRNYLKFDETGKIFVD